ncbi:MAG: sulfurtransferase [Planctomycetes bacterium]|nr:sulfurtransferase [Planctomycetota bacterium]
MPDYAHPDVLVSTDWVLENLNNPKVKFVEIDVDTKQYDVGHVPGAIGFNWQTQLQDQVSRDIISRGDFEKLMGGAGITPQHTVVVYGDNNNWFAAYGFWLMKYYGHADVRMMNGGRSKWLNEANKPLSPDKPAVTAATYAVGQVHPELRARVPEVLEVATGKTKNLVDVRSPDEFTGKVIAPPGMSETAQRAGHVPGAKSIPWSKTVNQDGTFKTADELHKLYFVEAGLSEAKPTICYCRIGERSSHSWFVLKYLLGQKDCKNYDGSWTEYGNLVGVPIEKNV